ncbi:hypothetical protein JK358_37275 [Nocardia sp. 2]|uniref:DUF732 domain-containing protein n=1 Tax=Nocardia acididurans TaxID=2802282 RepID=A0ABS1MK76_9NOCA|nr:hypothetical protein [Nocardia acididurans]MBL1080064.1 hypothetical protein [Nocardia acididurans]
MIAMRDPGAWLGSVRRMNRGGFRVGVLIAAAAVVAAGLAACGSDVEGTAEAPSSSAAGLTVRASTTTRTSAPAGPSAVAPTGDLTTMTCTEFLKLDGSTQKSTLTTLADQLGYATKVNPNNYLIVQSLCKTDESKLVKDWLGRA